MDDLVKFLRQMLEVPGVSDIRLKMENRTGQIKALIHARKEKIVYQVPENFHSCWSEITTNLLPGRPEVLGSKEYEEFCDVPYGDDGLSMRFRASLTTNLRGETLVLRVLPSAIPTPASIGLPATLVEKFIAMNDGLFLIVGQTNSGKSTSIASMVMARAQVRDQTIITLEDPVEYIYPPTVGGSDFDQRQVGRNTESFASGLKAAMRQAPDVIVVGEIRDSASAATALTAAMSGHFIVGTMHSTFAWQGPQRLFSFVDNDASGMKGPIGLEVVSTALVGVVAQRLLRNHEKGGLVSVHEILLITPGVSQKIVAGSFKSIKHEIETGAGVGMQTFAQAIEKRVAEKALPPTARIASG